MEKSVDNLYMKYILSAFIVCIIASCALKVDKIKAQQLVENYLEAVKNENYGLIENYYSNSFNESEPLEKKIEKLERLKKVTGPIQSYQLVSAEEKYDSVKGMNEMQLKYRVKCERLTVIHTFLVINDEGDEKIIFQNIENAN
jgi:hypothetical protein